MASKNHNYITDNEHLRSRTVNEILEGSPGFLVKYGLQLFLTIFLLLLSIVFFVQLPTSINTDVQIHCKAINNQYQQQDCIEIILPETYKIDVHVGMELTIRFLNDTSLNSKGFVATVTKIVTNTSTEKFMIKADLPGYNHIHTATNNIIMRHSIVSYNVRLIQLIARNIAPKI